MPRKLTWLLADAIKLFARIRMASPKRWRALRYPRVTCITDGQTTRHCFCSNTRSKTTAQRNDDSQPVRTAK